MNTGLFEGLLVRKATFREAPHTLRAMLQADEYDCVILNEVQHRVWESMSTQAADLPVHCTIAQRCFHDAIDGVAEFLGNPGTQAGLSLVVPVGRFAKVLPQNFEIDGSEGHISVRSFA